MGFPRRESVGEFPTSKYIEYISVGEFMTINFLEGDVPEVLKTLPNDHFDCVVTSPPYFNLRSYLLMNMKISQRR